MNLQSPHNPTYSWLRPYIEETLIPKKTTRDAVPTLSGWADNINCLLFEPFVRSDPTISLRVQERWHSFLHLNHLSLERLKAIANFMRDREQIWQQRQALASVKNRQHWKNHLVFHLHQPYATSHVARIIDHAANRYHKHLGDCWLVQFKRDEGWGNIYYVEASEIFSMSLPRWQTDLEPLPEAEQNYSFDQRSIF
ncbi:hypothetical protein ACQ4M3_00895 [Leptolyngbya sp. AN03gr2]|uniref:hypothetical protein n=1 Tax=unclassified Leptolyngbya TaxID=2650499 RepID=UPI003D31CD24